MMVNEEFKKEYSLSDIRDSSLTGMINDKASDRAVIVSTIYWIIAVLYLIILHPILMGLMNIRSFLIKFFIFLIISGIGFYNVWDIFVLEKRKRAKIVRKILETGGDLISYFMKIKDIKIMDFGFPQTVTVIETPVNVLVPMEVTYLEYEYYSRFLDSINKLGFITQEFDLRGTISLFNKPRSRYSKYEGSRLIEFLEGIFRENERLYKQSTSRRLYVFVYIPYSKDLQTSLYKILTSSYCNIQFLTESMYKEVVESYFNIPVNLERLKAFNKIRNISLDGTKFLKSFNSEEELEMFIRNYKTVNLKYKKLYERRLPRGRKQQSFSD